MACKPAAKASPPSRRYYAPPCTSTEAPDRYLFVTLGTTSILRNADKPLHTHPNTTFATTAKPPTCFSYVSIIYAVRLQAMGCLYPPMRKRRRREGC